MSKEEALKAWEQMYSEIDKENWLFVGTINPQMVEWAIKALKGADAYKKIKEGRWIIDKVYYAGNGKLSGFTAKCSECGFTYKTNYSDYCPGCGTKMKINKWWRDNG